MRVRQAAQTLLALLTAGACLGPAIAGDALSGRVVEVKSAELVTLDYGAGRYYIRVVGIDVPDKVSAEATELVRKLALGQTANIRFDHWASESEIVARVFIVDPVKGRLKDLGLELVRFGLALREKDYDYKYGELSAAEEQAQKSGRGLWEKDRR